MAAKKARAVSKTGRNPAQKAQRVTRVPPAPRTGSLGPGPVSAAADLAANRTPPKASQGSQAGTTKPGAALPVKNRPARSKPTTVSGTPNVRDNTQAGTTIASRANATGKRRKAAG